MSIYSSPNFDQVERVNRAIVARFGRGHIFSLERGGKGWVLVMRGTVSPQTFADLQSLAMTSASK